MAHVPVKASILWPDESAGPWCITVWWRVQYGVPTPVGFAVTSWNEQSLHAPYPTGDQLPLPDADVAFPKVEGQVLRQLPMTELLARTRELASERLALWDVVAAHVEHAEQMSRRILEVAPDAPPQLLTTAGDVARVRTAKAAADAQIKVLRSRGGTRDLGDDHYREVARVYSEAVQRGDPPTKAVQERFVIEKSSAAKKVARARERGFLPATTRGRTGRLKETP